MFLLTRHSRFAICLPPPRTEPPPGPARALDERRTSLMKSSGPDRRQPHARLRALPGAGEGGDQAGRQRPFTFTPDGNPLVGPAPGVKNYWAACGVLAGFSQGGGGGLALAPLDDRRRPGHGRLGDGRGALRRLRGAGLRAGDGPPDLRHPLPGALPQRGAPGRAAPAPHPDPRPPEGEGGGVRRRVRAGAGAVVRAARGRAGRDPDLPPLQRPRSGGRGMPRGARGVGITETSGRTTSSGARR